MYASETLSYSLSLDEDPDRPVQLFFYIWCKGREVRESTAENSVMEQGQALAN